MFEIASDGGQLHKVLLETYLETFKIPQTKTELFSGQELYLLVNCNINKPKILKESLHFRVEIFFYNTQKHKVNRYLFTI